MAYRMYRWLIVVILICIFGNRIFVSFNKWQDKDIGTTFKTTSDKKVKYPAITACSSNTLLRNSVEAITDKNAFPEKPTNLVAQYLYYYMEGPNGQVSTVMVVYNTISQSLFTINSIYSTDKRGIDEKVYVYSSDVRNTTDQDDAYIHSAIVKTPEKHSSLASCVTIASTSNVDPGIVVI